MNNPSNMTEEEKQFQIGRASSDFDDGELADVCAIAYDNIMDLIAAKDATAVGNYMMFLRRQRIADIASKRIYGKVGMISEKEVKV